MSEHEEQETIAARLNRIANELEAINKECEPHSELDAATGAAYAATCEALGIVSRPEEVTA